MLSARIFIYPAVRLSEYVKLDCEWSCYACAVAFFLEGFSGVS